MLLTPPRLLDVTLGIAFMLSDAVIFTCSHYILMRKEDTQEIQHTNLLVMFFGFLQSIIGFIAGLWLARITQVNIAEPVKQADVEEEMMLIDEMEIK
jgi:hypothetical protein